LAAAVLFSAGSLWARSSYEATRLDIDLSDQLLRCFEGPKLVKSYVISSSRFGIGNRSGSYKTPLGRHRIASKIGSGMPIGAAFKNGVSTGQIVPINLTSVPTPGDFLTTRVMWLKGLEPGKNKGRGIDSFRRGIAIHGTPDEGLLGRPASHGCIRMKNTDVVELFDRVRVGTSVDIHV